MPKNPYTTLARQTITALVQGERINEAALIAAVPDPGQDLAEPAACFVSLHRSGRLRGCIGTLQPTRPSLGSEIIRNAIAAASQDPRFRPLRAAELVGLEISVDVLHPAEPVTSKAELDPRRYGVLVSAGYRRGVLLPDLEGVDTVEDQLAIACEKAGIRPHEPYSIERFEVTRHVDD
ncbi:MAG: AmmeMemoRadiSam system protein A [Bacillota bacterium]|nr:AmmeMemoRadiSam system protein A [Bacillota bacterium]